MPQACLADPAPSRPEGPEPAPPPAARDGLAALARAYRRRRRPADAAEELALDELVACLWRGHQLAALEIDLLGRLARGEDPGPLPRLETLVRYGNRLERARRSAALELDRLRGEPAPRAQLPEHAAPEPAAPEPPTGQAPATAVRSAHAAPEPPAGRPAGAAARFGHVAPEPAARSPGAAVGSAHAAPEPGGLVRAPAAAPAPPWAAPAAPAGRAALLGSASTLALVAGLEAAGVPPPDLPALDLPLPDLAPLGPAPGGLRAAAQRA
jgi:hypothetical protein